MSETHLYLFDDGRARRWAPFSLTRPVGELLYGCMTLRERAALVFGTACLGHISRRALVGFDEVGAAPGMSLDQVESGGTRIFLSSRAAPELQDVDVPTEPALITVDGTPAGWVLPGGAELPSELWLRDPSIDPGYSSTLELTGEVLDRPWDLVDRNPERITADIEALWPESTTPEGVVLVGGGGVSLAETADVEPGIVFDTREGPIRLAEGTRAEGPARLTGPLYVGPGTLVGGGSVATSSIGPMCRVRGEISKSILIGFTNKAHDGYLGHALVGRWVNLGALTTNSDLKNNYGTVKVWTPDGDVDTGHIKIGCFLGDHVKTGIGTTLNTGTVVGAGSNLFGGTMPPVAVPPFSWGSGSQLTRYRLKDFLGTAQRVMARRGIEMTPGVEWILEEAWRATANRPGE